MSEKATSARLALKDPKRIVFAKTEAGASDKGVNVGYVQPLADLDAMIPQVKAAEGNLKLVLSADGVRDRELVLTRNKDKDVYEASAAEVTKLGDLIKKADEKVVFNKLRLNAKGTNGEFVRVVGSLEIVRGK